MARSQGWSVIAETALELAALALVLHAMDLARGTLPERKAAAPRNAAAPPAFEPAPAPDFTVRHALAPLEFVTEGAGAGAKYYRAEDERGEVFAGFYADGRVRVAGGEHRFAGALENGHADLLDVANNLWSELFVRVTPDDRIQLELRGGPYDARIFTCEPFDERMN